jgi:hypothetical protein
MLEDEGEEIGVEEAAGAAGAVDARGRRRRGSGRCGCRHPARRPWPPGRRLPPGGPGGRPVAGPARRPGWRARPARDGRGVRAGGGDPEPGPEAIATGAAAAGPGPRRIEPTPGREDDALDLLEVAGAATAKRVLPLVALLAAIAALVWWLRRR